MRPTAALAPSTYTVTLSGAEDMAGNPMASDTWAFTTGSPPPPPPDQGPGGPVAIVTSSANPSSKFLAEILRTEGLNAFTNVSAADVSASTLSAFDVVVLGAVDLTEAQVTRSPTGSTLEATSSP